MVLRPLESRGSTAAAGTGGHGRKGDHVILRQPIASDNCDLGQTLLGLWQAKLTLLGLVLELQGYLAGERDSLEPSLCSSCSSYVCCITIHIAVSSQLASIQCDVVPIVHLCDVDPVCVSIVNLRDVDPVCVSIELL